MYVPQHLRPSGFEMLTVANAAGGIGITATLIDSKEVWAVLGPLETAQIRYTVDGTAPTTSVGHLLEIGQGITLTEPNEVKGFLAIRTGGTSGSLPVTVYKA